MPVSISSTEDTVWSLLQEIVPFFCLVYSSLSAFVSICQHLCRVGFFHCLLFHQLSSQAGRHCAAPEGSTCTVPGHYRGVLCALISTGSCRVFRSTEMSSRWERCLQRSVNITISHFKRCHCMSSFHFLIGDRSIRESLWCKVSSSYRSTMHMLRARNDGYLYGSLRRKEGFFFMSSGNDSLYIMFPPHR